MLKKLAGWSETALSLGMITRHVKSVLLGLKAPVLLFHLFPL